MVWHDLQFCSSLSLLAFPPAGNQGLARGKPCCRTKLPIVRSAFKCLAPCCTSFIVSLNPTNRMKSTAMSYCISEMKNLLSYFRTQSVKENPFVKRNIKSGFRFCCVDCMELYGTISLGFLITMTSSNIDDMLVDSSYQPRSSDNLTMQNI